MKKITLSLLFLVVCVCYAQENTPQTGYWVSTCGSYTYYHVDKSCPMLSPDKATIDVRFASSLEKIYVRNIHSCKVCVEHKDGVFSYNSHGRQITMEQYQNDQAKEALKVPAINTFEVAAPNADVYAVKNAALNVTSKVRYKVGAYYPLLQVARAKDMKLAGADIFCQVIERRKSNLTGAEGVLRFRPICIRLTDGTEIPLMHDDIFLRGRNRSNVKWWLFPMLPIAGEGAKLNPDQEIPLYFK